MSQVVWLALVVTGIVAVGALDVLFVTANIAQPQVPLVVDEDPCRLVVCGPAKIRAFPSGLNPLTGNVRCKCPNHPEVYYEVSPERKY